MFFPFKIRSLQQLHNLLEQSPDAGLLNQLKEDPVGTLKGITQPAKEEELSAYKIQSVQQLREALSQDPRLVDFLAQDPLYFMQKMVKEPPPPQYRIYKMLVICLSAIVFFVLLAILYRWAILGSSAQPQTLATAIACISLGLLAGIVIAMQGRHEQRTMQR
jgi:hypothetical protein